MVKIMEPLVGGSMGDNERLSAMGIVQEPKSVATLENTFALPK